MANYTRITKAVEAIQYDGENSAAIIAMVGGAAEVTMGGLRINKGEGLYLFPQNTMWVIKDAEDVISVISNTNFEANYEAALE